MGCLTSPYASAFEPFVVRDIRVDGIQRTEAGTVFSYLPVHVGDTMTDEKAAEAIKALFATGFFKDVRLEVEKDVLVVLVEERPAIAAVDFVGAKEFDKDVLKRALKEIGVAESRIFDRSSLERAEQELKRQYLSHGKYGLRITTTVTPLERNRVAISFKLDEGQIAKIQGINFVGNQAFKESVLVDQMKLATPGWMSWFTKSDQYSRQKLSGDLETLRSFYLDRGYMEFQIDSTQVSISADKKEVFLTINITEGEKFTISDVKLAGDLLGREQELTALIKIKRGEAYSGTQMNETLKAITDRLGAFGYAFANANAAPDIDRDKHQVAFTIFVDPGRRVYVRQVNVIGNSRTRDVVIRREMRQFESSWYDAEKVTQSRDRVDRLGYFKEVAIETPPVTGVTDQVDVNVRVEEKPTGSFTLGAGFSSSEKVILTTGIQEQNIFGSGKSLALNVNTSKANTTYVLSHGDPYFTEDGVSRSTDLAFRKTQGGPLGLGTFVVKTSKLGVRFGVPTSDYDRMSYGLAYEGTDLQLDSTSPLNYQTYASEFGNKSNALVASVGWSRDTRDSGLAPSKGRFSRADLDVTVPAGDLRYARATYQDQYYYKVSRDYTIAFNGEIDYGKGFGGKPYPIFKNFFAGGIGSVRGYKDATLGPRDANGNPTGGASRLFGNVEFLMPMPGLGSDRTVRLFGFFDGGNVYAEGQKIQLSDLRYSVGFGVNWLSPMGPFKLSFGHALNRKEPEQAQSLQFTFGTGF
ncbi:MAG: outer membrane protein assembly factor BamA [Burkholderiaceae bacterium]|nr:MAG: outer membrane protein assembly factor BamA [Burkholderiaceae bacterium]